MIEKITDQNLERYDSRLKEWCDRKFFEKGNYGKYETTEEAGAVAFYPAPNTPLEGKMKFSFTETPLAEGDKGPENPSTIAGVSSVKVTRCGKNLIPTPLAGATTINNVTFTVNADGSIAVKGTASATCYFDVWEYSNAVKAGESYSLSGCPSGGGAGTFALRLEGSVVNSGIQLDYGSGVSFIADENLASGKIRIRVGSGITIDKVFYPQFEPGSTVTSFEPYEGTDYTLSLGNTYYGGEIDLATGVMTITHVECIADGTNIYAQSSVDNIGVSYRHAINVVTFGLPAPIIGDHESSSSTHFTCIDGLYDSFGVFSQASQYIIICDKDGLYPTNQSFNDWLKAQNASGTPVKFVYTIANPFTISLTPVQISTLIQQNKYTPELNTMYTDANSVQISYLKSPIRDEYEKTQAILSLGGNS